MMSSVRKCKSEGSLSELESDDEHVDAGVVKQKIFDELKKIIAPEPKAQRSGELDCPFCSPDARRSDFRCPFCHQKAIKIHKTEVTPHMSKSQPSLKSSESFRDSQERLLQVIPPLEEIRQDTPYSMNLRKLYRAQKLLDPIINEIILSASQLTVREIHEFRNDNFPICYITAKQFKDTSEVIKIFMEVFDELTKRRTSFPVEADSKSLSHFNEVIVNTLYLVNKDDPCGSPGDQKVYVDKFVLKELIQLHEVLGCTIAVIQDAEKRDRECEGGVKKSKSMKRSSSKCSSSRKKEKARECPRECPVQECHSRDSVDSCGRRKKRSLSKCGKRSRSKSKGKSKKSSKQCVDPNVDKECRDTGQKKSSCCRRKKKEKRKRGRQSESCDRGKKISFADMRDCVSSAEYLKIKVDGRPVLVKIDKETREHLLKSLECCKPLTVTASKDECCKDSGSSNILNSVLLDQPIAGTGSPCCKCKQQQQPQKCPSQEKVTRKRSIDCTFKKCPPPDKVCLPKSASQDSCCRKSRKELSCSTQTACDGPPKKMQCQGQITATIVCPQSTQTQTFYFSCKGTPSSRHNQEIQQAGSCMGGERAKSSDAEFFSGQGKEDATQCLTWNREEESTGTQTQKSKYENKFLWEIPGGGEGPRDLVKESIQSRASQGTETLSPFVASYGGEGKILEIVDDLVSLTGPEAKLMPLESITCKNNESGGGNSPESETSSSDTHSNQMDKVRSEGGSQVVNTPSEDVSQGKKNFNKRRASTKSTEAKFKIYTALKAKKCDEPTDPSKKREDPEKLIIEDTRTADACSFMQSKPICCVCRKCITDQEGNNTNTIEIDIDDLIMEKQDKAQVKFMCARAVTASDNDCEPSFCKPCDCATQTQRSSMQRAEIISPRSARQSLICPHQPSSRDNSTDPCRNICDEDNDRTQSEECPDIKTRRPDVRDRRSTSGHSRCCRCDERGESEASLNNCDNQERQTNRRKVPDKQLSNCTDANEENGDSMQRTFKVTQKLCPQCKALLIISCESMSTQTAPGDNKEDNEEHSTSASDNDNQGECNGAREESTATQTFSTHSGTKNSELTDTQDVQKTDSDVQDTEETANSSDGLDYEGLPQTKRTCSKLSDTNEKVKETKSILKCTLNAELSCECGGRSNNNKKNISLTQFTEGRGICCPCVKNREEADNQQECETQTSISSSKGSNAELTKPQENDVAKPSSSSGRRKDFMVIKIVVPEVAAAAIEKSLKAEAENEECRGSGSLKDQQLPLAVEIMSSFSTNVKVVQSEGSLGSPDESLSPSNLPQPAVLGRYQPPSVDMGQGSRRNSKVRIDASCSDKQLNRQSLSCKCKVVPPASRQQTRSSPIQTRPLRCPNEIACGSPQDIPSGTLGDRPKICNRSLQIIEFQENLKKLGMCHLESETHSKEELEEYANKCSCEDFQNISWKETVLEAIYRLLFGCKDESNEKEECEIEVEDTATKVKYSQETQCPSVHAFSCDNPRGRDSLVYRCNLVSPNLRDLAYMKKAVDKDLISQLGNILRVKSSKLSRKGDKLDLSLVLSFQSYTDKSNTKESISCITDPDSSMACQSQDDSANLGKEIGKRSPQTLTSTSFLKAALKKHSCHSILINPLVENSTKRDDTDKKKGK